MKNHLKEIFEKNYVSLCNYATVIVRNRHTAEDIVQAVFIQLWENNKITQLRDPEIYLLKCVKYKCLDYLKSPKRKKEIFTDSLPDIHQSEIPTLREEDIPSMLHFFAAKLPPKMQRVFLLSRQEGMSYKEIAKELNISVKTVENQMGSALKKMRLLLQKYNYLPFFFLFFQ